MEFLHRGYTLNIPAGCFPFSTDSMLLADFVRLPKNATVLDLCAGCATLGTLLCAKDDNCCVTGVEIDPVAHEAALANIYRNALSGRLSSICADAAQFSGGNYHCCISNPPYYTGGTHSRQLYTARSEESCSAGALFAAAARNLRFGGDFFLVHKPDRLAQLCALGTQNGLEAKRLRLIRHQKDGNVILILLQLRKGAKPGLLWEEEYLHEANGEPSEYFKKLYHLHP